MKPLMGAVTVRMVSILMAHLVAAAARADPLATGRRGALAGDRSRSAGVAVAQAINDHRFSIIHGPFSALADYVAERELTTD